MQFASAPPRRRRESSIPEDFSHVRVLSAAGRTDWITASGDLKKTQWTSNRVLGPPLWTALAMEVTNHCMYRGGRLRVLVLDIFILMCASLCFVCTDINCVGGGYTRTCTSVSLCERVVYASSQHAAERSPFFIFPIPPKSSYISAMVLPLTKLLASRTE